MFTFSIHLSLVQSNKSNITVGRALNSCFDVVVEQWMKIKCQDILLYVNVRSCVISGSRVKLMNSTPSSVISSNNYHHRMKIIEHLQHHFIDWIKFQTSKNYFAIMKIYRPTVSVKIKQNDDKKLKFNEKIILWDRSELWVFTIDRFPTPAPFSRLSENLFQFPDR